MVVRGYKAALVGVVVYSFLKTLVTVERLTVDALLMHSSVMTSVQKHVHFRYTL